MTSSSSGKLRVQCFGLSLDGYGAGPNQSIDHPLGVGGKGLMEWFFPTRTFQQMVGGAEPGTTGTDEAFAQRGLAGIGAWILGRNMFAPSRGAWPDDGWKGWWGDTPPFHSPVFVLTHHPREPIKMKGGTTFHFVTEGIHVALARAREAARGKDVRLGGGTATVRQYLQARLIDELHLAVGTALLGGGEHLLSGLDLPKLGYHVSERVVTDAAMHVVLTKRG